MGLHLRRIGHRRERLLRLDAQAVHLAREARLEALARRRDGLRARLALDGP